MKKIEIWSSFPSPVGGVSIHAYRLLNALSDKEKVIGVNFSDEELRYPSALIRKRKGIFKEICRLMFVDKQHYVHLHTIQLLPLLVLSFLFKKRILITLHNKRLLSFSPFKKQVYLYVFKRVRNVFINESTVYTYLKNNHINVLQVPAFLPPSEFEKESLPKSFVKFRESKKDVLSMSIWSFNEESFKVYGLRYVIPILEKFKDVGICLCISGKIDVDTLQMFKNDLKKSGHGDRVVFLENQVSNGSIIWRESDIFLRPTSTDAEGISIKEALYFNTPVIASDVCERALGTVVFKSGDVNDLLTKINDLLVNLKQEKNQLYLMDKSKISSSELYLKKVYTNILAE